MVGYPPVCYRCLCDDCGTEQVKTDTIIHRWFPSRCVNRDCRSTALTRLDVRYPW